MKKYFFYIVSIFNIIAFVLYSLSVLKRTSYLAIILSLSLLYIIGYFITNHCYNKTQKKIGLFSIKSNFFIVICSLKYEVFYKIYATLSKVALEMAQSGGLNLDMFSDIKMELPPEVIQQNIQNAQDRINNMGVTLIIATIIIDISLIIFITSKFKNNQSINSIMMFIDSFDITNIKNIFKQSKVIDLEKPDVEICKDPQTNKSVILPYKDRFLHMLILGPTGCGKTSQTIIPLINQDMKTKCGITVIEPKGDLAEKVWAMGEHYSRKVVYFNPVLDDCPYFNPLFGKEEEVIENMSTTFKMLNADSQQFFLDQNDNLVRNALKVLKRLEAQDKGEANLINLNRIIYNTNGDGRKLVIAFSKLNAESEDIKKENEDLASWFIDDYYKEKSKTYEHCSGLRSQVSKIISNKYLRRVLNPPKGVNDVNFDKHIEEGGVIAISTAQGDLRDLGKYLGYFIILQFQSAVFKRPGNENTRLAHMLYIDEFQEFSNPGFGMMLTQGRSYRVASHLATQNRDLMAMGGGRDGQNFVKLVDTNARNLIIYPGGNYGDAEYYSRKFGEVHEVTDKEKVVAKKGLVGLNTNINRTVTTEEQKKARFSPTQIMYRPFGEVTYALIVNNSIQPPNVGKLEYIPMNLNIKLDAMIEDLKSGKIKQSHIVERNAHDIKTQSGIDYNLVVDKKENQKPNKLFDADKLIDMSNSENYKQDDYKDDEESSIEFEFDSTSLKQSNKENTVSSKINSIFDDDEDEDDNDDLGI